MYRERNLMRVLSYIMLTPAVVLTIIPFFWMVSTAFKSRQEVFSQVPKWLPQEPIWSNFAEAWRSAPFEKYYVNTVIVVISLAVIQSILVILAAYVFGRMTFPGRDLIFFIFILHMTIKDLHLLDTKLAIMLPYFASAFGTFLLRQAFRQIPQELEDAARIDGCGPLRFLVHVGVPLVRPTLLTFIIISVVYHWNEFFWPLMVTESASSRTLTVGLSVLAQQTESGAEWTLLMAGTLFVALPLIVLFMVFQRTFIESFMKAGIQG
jgi:sn-glycerol 3-phosphate transport system permease protein